MAEIKIIDFGYWTPEGRGKVFIRKVEGEYWLDISKLVNGYKTEMNLTEPTQVDVSFTSVEMNLVGQVREILGLRKIEGPKLFNINNRVKVKMTEAGEDHYVGYQGMDNREQIRKDGEGYVSMQLHDLIRCFGAVMPVGLRLGTLPFETNIIIEGEDLREVEEEGDSDD